MDKEKNIPEWRKKSNANLVPIKPGHSGNPKGRPKGLRNFTTIFYDALKKIAEKDGVDPDSIETAIVERALLLAKEGDHKFFKDLMDRVHGQALQKQDITSDGKAFGVVVLPEKDEDSLGTSTETEDSAEEQRV